MKIRSFATPPTFRSLPRTQPNSPVEAQDSVELAGQKAPTFSFGWMADLATALVGHCVSSAVRGAVAWLGFGEPQGPRAILGHVGTDEANIWGRGDEDRPYLRVRLTGPDGPITRDFTLLEENGYTVNARFRDLAASTDYSYQVLLSEDGEKWATPDYSSGQFQTDGEQMGETRFLFGSCNFHKILDNRPAFQAIDQLVDEHEPDFFLHLGDQIYADVPFPSTNVRQFRDQYEDAWKSPEARALLSQVPNYMILDDHEVVDNFSPDKPLDARSRLQMFSEGYWVSEPEQRARMLAAGFQAYREFQHSHNPQTFGSEALHYTFSKGESEFFVLDARSQRNHERGEMIGSAQLERLKSWLSQHREQPQFVVTSVPFLAHQKSGDDKWTGPSFLSQRDELLDYIAEENIPGVVFLTGDVHNAYQVHTRLTNSRGEELMVHELSSSPINGALTRGIDVYETEVRGETEAGTAYHSQLDVDNFLGEDGYFDPTTSAVTLVTVDHGQVELEVFPTRSDDQELRRSGEFDLGLTSA